MTVLEKIEEFEVSYKSDGLKEGINRLLRKLSNNTLTISNSDPYLVDFYYLNIDYSQFEKDMNDLEIRDNLTFFDIKKGSNRTGEIKPFTVNLREIFLKDPSANLNQILQVIAGIIDKKEMIKDPSII